MDTKKPLSYKSTTAKLRRLWEIANLLIGKHEDFYESLAHVERMANQNSNKFSSLPSDATGF